MYLNTEISISSIFLFIDRSVDYLSRLDYTIRSKTKEGTKNFRISISVDPDFCTLEGEPIYYNIEWNEDINYTLEVYLSLISRKIKLAGTFQQSLPF
jgi:hypothetical protein